jgi:hypothetical protein
LLKYTLPVFIGETPKPPRIGINKTAVSNKKTGNPFRRGTAEFISEEEIYFV